LEFKKVPKAAKYSLSYIDSDGDEGLIFKDVPFGTLQDKAPPKS
jgi:hypothetical protein